MKKGKVLLTEDFHPIIEDLLRSMGYECDWDIHIQTEGVDRIIEKYTGLLISTKIEVRKEMLDKATKLRFIARAGSGMENIDYEYARSKKIFVVNSPEGNRNAVAEHALGALLALFNKLHTADHELRNRRWRREENRGLELDGHTIALLGFGNTGSRFARKLEGFDLRVLAYDKYLQGFGNDFVMEATMSEIFKEADVLSIHLPLNEETMYLVNSDFINQFQKDFFLINTSRGKVVQTKDLIVALQSGKVMGAALDVFENENPDNFRRHDEEWFQALCGMPNVILSPHVAGWSKESKVNIVKVLAHKLKALGL